MNPPSALYAAMNKDRKPFTYTPGGLDLSEIKSERMAKRLMRNAMSQGVPEQPSPSLHSPPNPSTTLNAPNFNCLPVQVFPTFPLPANPKSLLRTRSNPSKQNERFENEIPYEEQLTTNGTQLDTKQCLGHNNKNNCSKYIPSNFEKTDLPISLNECSTTPKVCTHSSVNYGSSGYTEAFFPKSDTSEGKVLNSPDNDQQQYIDARHLEIDGNQSLHMSKPTLKFNSDNHILPTLSSNCISEKKSSKVFEEVTGTENKQKEVNVVKKETNTDRVIEEQNGNTNVEAAVTVKLPGKKTSAKTETKVEVVKKELPDGSVEEVKTTTTRTTIDGKTEITTKTETTIIPKEDDLEEEEIVEEEEEEEEQENDGNVIVQKASEEIVKLHDEEQKLKQEPIENITKREESSETSTTKNVTIIKSIESQNDSEEEIEEEEEVEEEEEEVENENVELTVTQKEIEPNMQKKTDIDDKIESEPGDEVEEGTSDKDEDVHQTTQGNNAIKSQTSEKGEEVEEVRKLDNVNDVCESEEENDKTPIRDNMSKDNSLQEKEEEEVSEENDDIRQEKSRSESDAANENEQTNASNIETVKEAIKLTEENKKETVIEVQVSKPELSMKEETNPEPSGDVKDNEVKPTVPTERNIPLREPSVPLEKVEDVEIKPIGQIISKSHTENTEIITTSIDKPTAGLSTQTAYNRIENIVTVNRTSKTLDQAYEQISQHGVPTVKTYFAPNDRPLISPQSSRTYQSVYSTEPQGERRHSLLLDRLSVDRQMPPTELYQSNYQYGNQTYEQNISSQGPQSEVLTVSNVKPSSITKNQQWYQETKKDEVAYNNTAPCLNVPSQQWNLQQSHLKSQPQSQPQPHSQHQLESAYQPSLQFQSPYIQNTQNTYNATSNTSSTYQQHSYPTYTQKPMQASPSINKQTSQFSYIEKDTPESYQRPSQQFSSTYVPPPWEQDPNYVADNVNHTLYSPPSSNKFTNTANQTWTPPTASTYSKPKPTSYIPPAPNQSFVKPVTTVDPPKMPGRKTYYSEYERRYISVPESTYIPTESKFQAQPNPSPQYYYDNYEPSETVEHEWRKELREFSEKTQTQSQSEKTLVKPSWEEDTKYYVPKVTTEYTPTPTWSQTLRPNSWRERSFESEFLRSQELPKTNTNTLGRGRPQSTYVKSNISTPIPERPRGVSVDRYNPNNYKSPTPSEYPPVQSHTLDPSVGAKTHHNANVPVYHSRASAEPREQIYPQTRQWGEARASPIQSRSFKYLQWITGTED